MMSAVRDHYTEQADIIAGKFSRAPRPEENDARNQPIVLPIEPYDDLQPVVEDTSLVEGAFDLNGLAVVYGPSNSGKTFWCMDLAMHVAAGMPWRELRVRCVPVLYLALEGGRGAVNRVVAWRQRHGVLRAPFYLVRSTVNLLARDPDVDSVVLTAKEVEARCGTKPGLIVVDTLARAMAGGNENAPEDMGALVANADRIRKETDAALWFVHHSGKDEAKGARGHSSLRAATDTEIEIANLPEAGHRTARATKQREMEMGDSWGFQLAPVTLAEPPQRKAVTSCTVDQLLGETAQTHGGRALPSGQARRAYEILCDLIAGHGKHITASANVPPDVLAVQADEWREAFYLRAMPAQNQEAKKKAFQRASNDLLERKLIGLYGGQVWTV